MVAVRAETTEWTAVGTPLRGNTVSGDRYLVKPLATGALAMVADGLGHGKPAAEAAERALSAVNDCAESVTVSELALRCHVALQGDSRGAVLSLAKYDAAEGIVTWLGVGNVEGRLLLRTAEGHYIQESLLLHPGIVGQHLPDLRPSVMRVSRGDLLIFATDGIVADFAGDIQIDARVEEIAKHISVTWRKQTDDALVLVMRCLGHADAG